jgi:hypothetical protein
MFELFLKEALSEPNNKKASSIKAGRFLQILHFLPQVEPSTRNKDDSKMCFKAEQRIVATTFRFKPNHLDHPTVFKSHISLTLF